MQFRSPCGFQKEEKEGEEVCAKDGGALNRDNARRAAHLCAYPTHVQLLRDGGHGGTTVESGSGVWIAIASSEM